MIQCLLLITIFFPAYSYLHSHSSKHACCSPTRGLISDRLYREIRGEDDRDDDDGNAWPLNFERLDRDRPDFASLAPDDPLFLDMPWPEKAGPEATAYSKHVQWKRRLSDGERMRWQKWAVYQRSMLKNKFDYSIEDYIAQNLASEIKNQAVKAPSEWEAATWRSIAEGRSQGEEDDIQSTVAAFYSALNRKCYDDLHVLLLPDENTVFTLPGYSTAVWRIHLVFTYSW